MATDYTYKPTQQDDTTAQAIKEINSTKPYTLIATDLLNSLLTDKMLNATAIRLWQYLYNKARFNKQLSIKIGYSEIATELSKSSRTIIRCVNNLKDYGYLLISHNYNINGQELNTFYLRFPESTLGQVKNKKNRIEPSLVAKKDKVATNKPKTPSARLDNINKVTKPSADEQAAQSISNQQDISEPACLIPHQVNAKDNSNQLNPSESLQQQFVKESIIVGVNNEQGRGGQTTLSELERVLADYDKQLQQVYELEPSTTGEKHSKLDALKELHTKMANITVQIMQQKAELERLPNDKNDIAGSDKDVIQKESIDQEKKIKNNVITVFSSNLETERQLNHFQCKRITQALTKLGFHGSSNTDIQHEIIFAIEQDSLRYGKDGQELTINHAINIAIKLVRTNRWRTPGPIWQAKIQKSEKIASQCYYKSGESDSLLLVNQ